MRIKNVFKNLISEMLPQVIIAFLGIYKSKVFLAYMGTDVVGLYQLFSQILGYLSLVEGGLGSAVIYRLYKPIYDKDYQKLGSIRNGIKRIFNIMILIILVLATGIGFIIPNLIKDNSFSIIFIEINFLLYVVSELLLYTTVFERSMFTATEKNYRLNAVVKTTLILKAILEIIIAVIVRNVTIVFIMFVMVNLISNVAISLMAKAEFKFIEKTDKRDYSVLKDVKNLLVHKIAGVVSTNIDIVIVSAFMGLKKVVVYSTYLLYSNTITSFMNKISNAFLGSIGNKLLEDKEDSYRIFKQYNSLMFFVATIVGVQFFFSIDYFINIWYNWEVETNIVVSILFAFILTYSVIRIPLITFTEAAGLFRETRICPVLEAIINLVLSLILINFLGIPGLLIGTLTSLVVSEFFIKPRIVFKKIFDKRGIDYYKLSYKFIIILIIEMALVYYIKTKIIITGLLNWVLYSVVFALVNLLIISIIYILIFKQNFFIERIKQIFSKDK